MSDQYDDLSDRRYEFGGQAERETRAGREKGHGIVRDTTSKVQVQRNERLSM